VKVRSRNRPSGIIGWALRASMRKDRAPLTAPATSPAEIRGFVQPRALACVMAAVRQATAVAPTTWPGTSRGRRMVRTGRGAWRTVGPMPSSPTGRLIRKTLRQPNHAISAPPSTGPAASAKLPAPAHRPIAEARSRASGNERWRSAMADDTRSAAPLPRSRRAPSSAAKENARPQAAAPKQSSPASLGLAQASERSLHYPYDSRRFPCAISRSSPRPSP